MSDSDKIAALEKISVNGAEELYDPDAGLSDEEKREIVSRSPPRLYVSRRLTSTAGTQAAVAARPEADPMGEFPSAVIRPLLDASLTARPQLCFLYLICFLDRTNIGNAKIAHLTTDIPMDTWHFNHTLTIFFIAYAMFEALANFLLKKLRPSIFIPIIM